MVLYVGFALSILTNDVLRQLWFVGFREKNGMENFTDGRTSDKSN